MQPGRADAYRPALEFLVGLGVVLALWGCAGPPAVPRQIASVWRDYEELPPERALAIAGELRHARWVAGASGGQPSRAAAEAEALRQCAKRRAQRRMLDPCHLYAVGDEVVWPGR